VPPESGDIAVISRLVIVPAPRAISNHAEVARTLGIDIITGHYPEGAKLPGDAELIRLFGVSRPVLREGVKTLVAKGLLSTKAKVGTVVRNRSAWNMFDADVLAWHLEGRIDSSLLFDLGEIRLAVEPRSAALAAQQRSHRPGKPAADDVGVAITICANRGFGKIAQVLSFITSRPRLRGHATTDTDIR